VKNVAKMVDSVKMVYVFAPLVIQESIVLKNYVLMIVQVMVYVKIVHVYVLPTGTKMIVQ
jgi:hypothetical protein